MKFRKMLVGAFVLIPSVSNAGVYLGASIGQTDSSSKDSFSSDNGNYVYTVIQNEKYDDKDTGFSAFFGYEFMLPDLSISAEAGYIDFGQNTYVAHGYSVWDPTGKAVVSAEANATGIYISGILKRMINDSFGVYGRIGVTSWDVDAKVNYTFYDVNGSQTGSDRESGKDSGADPHFGLGVQYEYFYIEYARHKISDTNTNFINLGFKY